MCQQNIRHIPLLFFYLIFIPPSCPVAIWS